MTGQQNIFITETSSRATCQLSIHWNAHVKRDIVLPCVTGSSMLDLP